MLQQKPCLHNVEIPGGRGVIKVPLGTEIPKGWGDANQKPSVGGVWIFSGTTQYIYIYFKVDSMLLSLKHKGNKKLFEMMGV